MTRRRVGFTLAGLAVLVTFAVLVTAVLHVDFLPRPHAPGAKRRPTPTPAVAATPNPAMERLVPGTLIIPRIGVRAIVEQVTVDSNNDMAAPAKPSDVGWYSPGVAPGQGGDAVIDGHLDWYGVPKAVFYYLNQLQVGDAVDVVSQSGVKLDFKVTDSTSVSRTSHPVGLFATTGSPRVTLITCAGDWNPNAGEYDQRLLVDAAFVGVG